MAYTTINKSTDYFNTVSYTGNGTNNAGGGKVVTCGFQSDFNWIKNRGTTANHWLEDSVRGYNNPIASNNANAQDTGAGGEGLSARSSSGFTVGNSGEINSNGNNYVAWNWKAGTTTGGTLGGAGITPSAYSFNSTAGFSILKYTGSGGNSSLPHFLGAIPDMITVKNLTDSSTNWRSIFPNMVLGGASNGADYNLNFNASNSWNNGTEFRDIMPDANIFRVSSADDVNKSGSQYIAYCFKNITGYSKVGSYTGNGNADGTFVYTGFKPAFIMTKRSNNTENWYMLDNKRSPFNPPLNALFANGNNAEDTNATGRIQDFLSNGFKLRTTDTAVNGSGDTYIYMAFAEAPLVGSNNVPCTAR